MVLWLKRIREERGLSQTSVAKMAGLRQSGYSMIELGERRPSIKTAKRISQSLGFDWTRFFEDGNPLDDSTSRNETLNG